MLLLLAVSLCFKVLAIHGSDQEVQHGRHAHQARQAVQRRVVQQGGRVHRALVSSRVISRVTRVIRVISRVTWGIILISLEIVSVLASTS